MDRFEPVTLQRKTKYIHSTYIDKKGFRKLETLPAKLKIGERKSLLNYKDNYDCASKAQTKFSLCIFHFCEIYRFKFIG